MQDEDKETINTTLVELTRGKGALEINERFLNLLVEYKIFSQAMKIDILVNSF